jgi:hypothetical protein
MRAFLFLAALVVFAAACPMKFAGAAWVNQSRHEKQETLLDTLFSNTNPGPFHGFTDTSKIFIENLDLSFTSHDTDSMFPQKLLFKTQCRQKVIHSVGAIGNVTFRAQKSQYTGIFKGSEHAIIRFSSAVEPTAKDGIIFGLVIKFQRSFADSANVFAMSNLVPTKDWNPFAHDYHTQVPGIIPSDHFLPTANKLLALKFGRESKFPTYLGQSDSATIDQHGNLESNITFPYRVVFHPTKAVHMMFHGATFTGSTYYVDLLKRIPNGKLFEVYAVSHPGGEPHKIGDIILNTPFETSNYGDISYFHRHQFYEEDLELRPEWAAATKAQFDAQANNDNKNTPYYWPDLPWN